MSEPLFEQYKAALRRGHLAVLAGRLDEALDAYRDAARLVPERPLPTASQGTVLHRLDRWPEAAETFEQALRLSPDDEATLRARAGAREERGLRSGAAADLERLAQVLDVAGRAADAADAARRAAELEDSPARAALAARLTAVATRATQPDAAAPPIMGPPPDPDALLNEAAALLEAGNVETASDRMLTAVLVHRAAGRLDAALDICLQLLSIVPGDPHVHLAIADLQLDHGWTALAREKIELLLRLTALTGDIQAEADTRGLASERLRDEPAASTATR